MKPITEMLSQFNKFCSLRHPKLVGELSAVLVDKLVRVVGQPARISLLSHFKPLTQRLAINL